MEDTANNRPGPKIVKKRERRDREHRNKVDDLTIKVMLEKAKHGKKTLRDIAYKCGTTKSTVFRIIKSIRDNDAVQQAALQFDAMLPLVVANLLYHVTTGDKDVALKIAFGRGALMSKHEHRIDGNLNHNHTGEDRIFHYVDRLDGVDESVIADRIAHLTNGNGKAPQSAPVLGKATPPDETG